ncbi:hypothetical protein MUP59_11165 [Candidatus Bathyarchaeota archaeon]|nr:hypothetical protein [Candidatus Bathyarchaeota archaeon]
MTTKKALFMDADGTLWYTGKEDGDGYQQSPDSLVVDPNLKILLDGLSQREIPLLIVSYNEPGIVEKAVEHLKLVERIPFDRISCNWRDKGERIKEMMVKAGVANGLFVGDRGSDYQASVVAGIEGRIIRRRFNTRFWNTGPTISSLLDILPILDTV